MRGGTFESGEDKVEQRSGGNGDSENKRRGRRKSRTERKRNEKMNGTDSRLMAKLN